MQMLCVIALLIFCSDVSGQTYEDMARLRQNLLQNYTKYNRPLRNQSDTLFLNIDVNFRMVEGFNIVEGVLGTHIFFTLQWVDEYITWNSTSYDNISAIYLPLTDVWVPQMVLLNPAPDSLRLLSDEKNMVRYSPDGSATLQFATYLLSMCKPTIEYFPYDTHTCHVMISHLGYGNDEVMYIPSHNRQYIYGRDWIVVAMDFFEKYVNPGYNNFRFVDLSIQLRSDAGLLTTSLFFPVSFLMCLNMCTFWIPNACGERISYAITCFLSVTIFMTIISDHLPPDSKNGPYINLVLTLHLLNNALLIMLTAVSLEAYHKSHTIIIPHHLRRVIMFTSRFTYLEKTTKKTPQIHMTPRTEQENDDATETGDITHHVAVPEDIDRRHKPFITWRNLSKVIDYWSHLICLLLTGVEIVLYGVILFHE